MKIDIRNYQIADKKVLSEIFLEARKEMFKWKKSADLHLDDFDELTKDEPVLLAVSGEQILGFVSWWPPTSFIHNLFVAKDFISKGVGKALLNACLAQLGRPVTLKCQQRNRNAIGFYQHHGWVIKSEGNSTDGEYYLMELIR